MRKVFLLMALSMIGALVFAPAVLAQSSSASADPCPDPEFPRETPDGCQASDLPDVVPGASVSATASASASAEEDVNCDDFASQFGAQQFYDFNSPPGDPYNLDSDGDGLACEDNAAGGSATPTADEEMDDSASPSASATSDAAASASALPDTGGPTLAGAVALPMLALLVAGGIFSFRLMRR